MTEPEKSRALRGIMYLLLALLIFGCMDAIVKQLRTEYPALFIMWVRYIFQQVAVIILLVRLGSFGLLRTTRPVLQTVRALINVGSSFFFLTGLAYLPLADAGALGMVSPMFVTALSVPFLGEKVGVRRWSAVIVGFIGALIIIRPGMGVVHPGALFILASALCYASYQITTRILSTTDAPATTLFYTTFVGLLASSAAVPFAWVDAPREIWALLAFQGTMAAVGHFFLISALSLSPASMLAPFNYTSLVILTVLGYIFFHQFPDHFTALGALIIVGSGLYIIYRERVRRAAAT
ncbi:MAG: DMT family transporter [Alphaproteobacteria bacterium]